MLNTLGIHVATVNLPWTVGNSVCFAYYKHGTSSKQPQRRLASPGKPLLRSELQHLSSCLSSDDQTQPKLSPKVVIFTLY